MGVPGRNFDVAASGIPAPQLSDLGTFVATLRFYAKGATPNRKRCAQPIVKA